MPLVRGAIKERFFSFHNSSSELWVVSSFRSLTLSCQLKYTHQIQVTRLLTPENCFLYNYFKYSRQLTGTSRFPNIFFKVMLFNRKDITPRLLKKNKSNWLMAIFICTEVVVSIRELFFWKTIGSHRKLHSMALNPLWEYRFFILPL